MPVGIFVRTEQHKRRISETHKGCKNPMWKGGKYKDDKGYIRIFMPDHPNARSGGYIREHRLVMEKKIGRYLRKKEVVHHINGIRHDNRIKNLVLMKNRSEHITLHNKLKNPD